MTLPPPTSRWYRSWIRPGCAVSDSLLRNVNPAGSFCRALWNSVLISSCSNCGGSTRGPCSSTTTVSPAVASSLAMMPRAAPEPTTTKSTVRLGSKRTAGRAGRMLPAAARRLGVVVAERRLPGVAVLEADHPPARLVGVAAVGGQREHPHERGEAHLLEEGRLFLRAQQFELALRRETGEALGARPASLHFTVQLIQTVQQRLALLGGPGAERAVQEGDDGGLRGARRVVGGKDLCGDGVEVRGLVWRQHVPGDRVGGAGGEGGAGGAGRVVERGANQSGVGREPGRPQRGRGDGKEGAATEGIGEHRASMQRDGRPRYRRDPRAAALAAVSAPGPATRSASAPRPPRRARSESRAAPARAPAPLWRRPAGRPG